MVFNSLTYLVFLILVCLTFFLIKPKFKLYVLVVGSLIFYGFWRIEFVPLLLSCVFVNWYFSLKLVENGGIRQKVLFVGIILFNLAILFFFKYFVFFGNEVIRFFNFFGHSVSPIEMAVILPLGISFFTFQNISYVCDVYRRVIRPEQSIFSFACYISFFPQLVAGPILRASEVIPQFVRATNSSFNDFLEGIRRITYGLFLKVVLADNIAPFVNEGFLSDVSRLTALDVWTLSFLFGFQIYFDFSAYSHIAIGSARLMGIKFPENFNFPYLSSSPKEFWQRWHISLSSWVRDYVYLPLIKMPANEDSKDGFKSLFSRNVTLLPLIITWILMGLWHGAAWTFVIWGCYHVIVILVYRFIAPFCSNLSLKVRRIGGLLITLPIMMLGWIPFRSESTDVALSMWLKVLNPLQYYGLSMRENVYIITTMCLIGTICVYLFQRILKDCEVVHNRIFLFIKTIGFCIVFLLSILFLQPVEQFIYFQF